jgi:hypothetical protein
MKNRAKGRSEQGLEALSRKYGLPRIEYSKSLRPGCFRFSRVFGTIYLAESFQSASRPEILRVAFYGAGRYHARPVLYDIAIPLFIMATLLSLTFVFLHDVFSGKSLVVEVQTPVFWLLWTCAFLGATYELKIHPLLSRRAANLWAQEHWPRELTEQGHPYTPVTDHCL